MDLQSVGKDFQRIANPLEHVLEHELKQKLDGNIRF
jgi:hypothetical protein